MREGKYPPLLLIQHEHFAAYEYYTREGTSRQVQNCSTVRSDERVHCAYLIPVPDTLVAFFLSESSHEGIPLLLSYFFRK